ncbi:MAG: amidohydrolase family protein [Oscillospiraceae bacterium]|jgi:predicted TIM-barrel fold metal-dependent hydrolase|nr:amidohydrolase family protein [Oscillospiraceae bacterium]
MMIDFHTHCFPDKIVGRAMSALMANSGIVEPFTNGSAGDLRRYMREKGIDKSVVLNIATNARQQKNVNDFAIAGNSDDLIMFGSVHPFAPDALDELRRMAAAGLKGVKFHPDYQEFHADDPAVFPVYALAAELGLITVFHAGVDCGLFCDAHCPPRAVKKILPVFGGAPVVAAHFGGYLRWQEVYDVLAGENVYFDTAFTASRIPKALAVKMIEKHGADKILFGSDLPWSGAATEAAFLRTLGLDEETAGKILGSNAERLLR